MTQTFALLDTVALLSACDASRKGQRQQVAYEADYVFYGS